MNTDGDLVIRQEATWCDESDTWIVVAIEHVSALVDRLLDLAEIEIADDQQEQAAAPAKAMTAATDSRQERRARVAAVLRIQPHLSNRSIAKETGVDHVTVGTVRHELESTGEIHQLAETIGADGKSRPTKHASAEEVPH